VKKSLVVLLVLCVFGFIAFAQDAPAPQGQFHAWNQGQFIAAASLNGGDITTGWGPGWDNAGGLDQEWSFTYDGKNFGYDATTEFGSANAFNSQPETGASGTTGFVYKGWSAALSWFGTYYKFGDSANPYAKIYLGMPRDNDYSFLSYINGNPVKQRLMDSQWGANLQVFPMSGVSIEFTDFVPPQTISGATGLAIADNFSVGAKYAIPDMATVFAYYKAIQNNYNSPKVLDVPNVTVGSTNTKYLDVGLKYSGMKGIGVMGEFAYDMTTTGTGTGVSDPLNQIDLYVGATTSKVANMNLAVDFFLHSNSSFTVFTVEANGQYNMADSPWAVGANIGYDGGAGQFNGGNGETPLAGTTGAGVLIQPYLSYTVDGGNGNVKISFVYAGGGVNNEATKNVATTANWGIPIVYTWSF